jgi:hypothetical protein
MGGIVIASYCRRTKLASPAVLPTEAASTTYRLTAAVGKVQSSWRRLLSPIGPALPVKLSSPSVRSNAKLTCAGAQPQSLRHKTFMKVYDLVPGDEGGGNKSKRHLIQKGNVKKGWSQNAC